MSVKVLSQSIKHIDDIVALLAVGEVVAAPTETAYGLLADVVNKRAVAKVIKIKGRELQNPLPLVAANLAQVKKYARLNKLELKLANKFWPGPLTLVLKTNYKFPLGIRTKDGTIGIRVPGSRWLRKLLLVYGKPLVATSANLAGQKTLYNPKKVMKHLHDGGLKYIVGQKSLLPKPTSTVARVVNNKIQILRAGAISVEIINKI